VSLTRTLGPAQNALFLKRIPYVYPEPVLVKMVVFSIKWRKKGVLRTSSVPAKQT
jgi:hypothetical protein